MHPPDQSRFRLPGHRINELAELKCLISLLAAHSRQWNPRNLEAPWYEPWTQIFTDLVAGHTSLSVCPQAYLWYDRGTHEAQLHTTPGPSHILSTEHEQLDEFLDDVGNITLESIKTIAIPNHRNRHRIPDIVITRKVSFSRPHDPIELLHLTRRVTYLGVPLIAELKQSGHRCNDITTSLANAKAPMSLARDQAHKQAQHLFQMYPYQDSVIVIAITGFWWSCMVLHREGVQGLPLPEDDDEMEEEEIDQEDEDPTLPDQNGIHPGRAPDVSGSEEFSFHSLQEQLHDSDSSSLEVKDIHAAVIQTTVASERRKLPEDNWSEFLLYGTPGSDDMFSRILDRLHSVVHVHYDGKMG